MLRLKAVESYKRVRFGGWGMVKMWIRGPSTQIEICYSVPAPDNATPGPLLITDTRDGDFPVKVQYSGGLQISDLLVVQICY